MNVDTFLDKLRRFEEKIGIRYMIHGEFKGISVHFEKRSGKLLKREYLKQKSKKFRELILEHPDCPKELKVAEEL